MSNVAREVELYSRYADVFKEQDRAVQAITAVHLTKQLQVHMSSNLDFDLILRHVLDLGSDNLFSRIRDDDTNTKGFLAGVHERNFALFIHRLATLMRLSQNNSYLKDAEYTNYILTESQRFYLGKFLSELNDCLLADCRPLKDEVVS